MNHERLMTAAELAIYLSCSLSTVRRLVASGSLPHYRLGKMVRFRRADVDHWLQRQQQAEATGSSRPADDHEDQLSLFAPAAGTPS
ncbi:MAG: helix-turn-helix domain-containing protein [Candidatus Latescibacterota bacterium]